MNKPTAIQELEKEYGIEILAVTATKAEAAMDYSLKEEGKGCFYAPDGEVLSLNLTELNITNFKVSAALSKLQYLDLSDNGALTSLFFEVGLPALKKLDVSDCGKIEEVVFPAGFDALERIEGRKALKKCTFLGAMPALKYLDLSDNQLEQLTLEQSFPSLTHLYLNDNPQLTKLTISTKLESLDLLHLANNSSLRNLPKSTIQTSPLKTLYANNTTPKNIPDVFLGGGRGVSNSLEGVRDWFKELDAAPSDKNKVVKLMITGNGGVGKTTLMCALQCSEGCCKCEDNHRSTHGIQIGNWKTNDIEFNYWDFGGQEIYHGTHRLFMASGAVQLIVFDPENQEKARKSLRVKDRIREDMILNHPIEYFYETNKSLSRGSQFIFVQNKRALDADKDYEVVKYADQQKCRFIHIDAKSGIDLSLLKFYLKEEADKLPEYGMEMPSSWIAVRQFFIEHSDKDHPNPIKIMTKAALKDLFVEKEVNPKTTDYLFKFLQQGGFIYAHENLGEKIIVDQDWALEAIYKILDRNNEDIYQEMVDYGGKILVRNLFRLFGDSYKRSEKWLFLEFMKSCGLCFKVSLEEREHQQKQSLSDLYVFPEFLPETLSISKSDWEQKAPTSHVYRHQMKWLNYFLIRSFISKLGSKAKFKDIWRNGINIRTAEGWIKVELDIDTKNILIWIEKSAEVRWLESVLKEFGVSERSSSQWEISTNQGASFEPFDFQKWKNQKANPIGETEEITEKSSQPISEQLPDIIQEIIPIGKPEKEKSIVLFLSANPTNKLISIDKEWSFIQEKVTEEIANDIVKLLSKKTVDYDTMMDAIDSHSPTILHFCGHGRSNEIDSDGTTVRKSGIILHNEDMTGEDVLDAETCFAIFKGIKRNHPDLRMVVLNACHSEEQAIEISKHDIYTVGSSDEIKSIAARHFAAKFYKEYLDTGNVIKSVDKGISRALRFDTDMEDLIKLYHNGELIYPTT